jgi:hypothetical protein
MAAQMPRMFFLPNAFASDRRYSMVRSPWLVD